MKSLLNEVKRMQELAGIATEIAGISTGKMGSYYFIKQIPGSSNTKPKWIVSKNPMFRLQNQKVPKEHIFGTTEQDAERAQKKADELNKQIRAKKTK
jgi:hypothetical protein